MAPPGVQAVDVERSVGRIRTLLSPGVIKQAGTGKRPTSDVEDRG